MLIVRDPAGLRGDPPGLFLPDPEKEANPLSCNTLRDGRTASGVASRFSSLSGGFGALFAAPTELPTVPAPMIAAAMLDRPPVGPRGIALLCLDISLSVDLRRSVTYRLDYYF